MALRMASQRWTSSPLVQTVMRSARQQQTRAFVDEDRRRLDAAEIRYIRRMIVEDKQRAKKAAAESSGAATPAGAASPLPSLETPAAPHKCYACYYTGTEVLAIFAVFAGYWLLYGQGRKLGRHDERS